MNLRETAERDEPRPPRTSGSPELEQRLATAESDVKELASRLVDSEHQGGRLMNLYVATYQLHATLDPAEVQATIAEIAINLLGAEQFVLLLRRTTGRATRSPSSKGCTTAPCRPTTASPTRAATRWSTRRSRTACCAWGRPPSRRRWPRCRCASRTRSWAPSCSCKLLDHKPILRAEDRDLLDLLSAHAASAMFAARLFATKDRKLRTLESLVKLARGRVASTSPESKPWESPAASRTSPSPT